MQSSHSCVSLYSQHFVQPSPPSTAMMISIATINPMSTPTMTPISFKQPGMEFPYYQTLLLSGLSPTHQFE